MEFWRKLFADDGTAYSFYGMTVYDKRRARRHFARKTCGANKGRRCSRRVIVDDTWPDDATEPTHRFELQAL
jgi:hypothetical protein